MEDLNKKLSQLINSPGGMEKLRAAAATLLGGAAKQEPEENAAPAPTAAGPDLSALLSAAGAKTGEGENNLSALLSNAAAMGNMMKVVQAVQGMKNDSSVELIRALKPYLSPQRAERAEKAIRFLKIAAVVPLLKQQGLLDLFAGG